MVSDKKAEEVLMFVESMGMDSAIENFGISKDSVLRYIRKAKKVFRDKFDDDVSEVPKVLFFDIETSMMEGRFWSLWKQNIDAVKQVTKRSQIICYSAKWLGQDEIMHDCCTVEEMLSVDDSRVSTSLWKLLDECEVAVAHNLIKFDRRKANTFFLLNGLNPPSPYKLIDTLQSVKKEFAFPSNRMDAINDMLGLTRKRDTGGIDLWNGCMDGDQESLDKMQYYCDGDIISLEDTYFAIAPWFRGNVNFAVFNNTEKDMCSHCGSHNVELTDKKYCTTVSRFPVFRCNKCGGYSRSRYSELTLKKRKNLLTSIGS